VDGKPVGARRANVAFLGACDRVALDAAYRRAWVVLIPSRWDTSPTVLLEAMLRAKAVMTSPYGGMPEYIGDLPGCVARPEDAAFADGVCALLASRHRRREVGEALQQRAVAEYGPRRAAEKYVAFVAGALGSQRRTQGD